MRVHRRFLSSILAGFCVGDAAGLGEGAVQRRQVECAILVILHTVSCRATVVDPMVLSLEGGRHHQVDMR